MLNIESFRNHLIQAAYWCQTRIAMTDPEHSLRSLPLAKSDGFIHMPHEKRIEIVSDLITERERQLGREKSAIEPSSENPEEGGKLLLFYPDGSLFDGAAAAASAGFFDWDNVPAWDTWIYYGIDASGTSENCDINFLVSWIPSELVRYVNGGIDVNPESCIEWATRIDRAFTQTLREHKLLY